jgi:hypothetical protein
VSAVGLRDDAGFLMWPRWWCRLRRDTRRPQATNLQRAAVRLRQALGLARLAWDGPRHGSTGSVRAIGGGVRRAGSQVFWNAATSQLTAVICPRSRLYGNLDFRAHLGLYAAEVFARNQGFSSNLGAERVLSCHWLTNKSAFTSAPGTVRKIRIIKVADFMEQLRGES